MNYREALDYLNSFTNYEKVPGLAESIEEDGLERVNLLMRLLGRPHRTFKSVLIAGTKGKGSVAAMLESILRHNGHHVGLYTSPHLHSMRERVRVDGKMIPARDLARIVAYIRDVVRRIQGLGDPTLVPTTYELITALAFIYFHEQDIEIAVLEVGLGGRLDATNIVTPIASIITSISYDHMQILGDTLSEIAFEKAGIIKEGGRVIVAPQEQEAMAMITYVAEQQGAELIAVGRDAYISTGSLPKIIGDDHGLPVYQVFTVGFDDNDDNEQEGVTTSVSLPLLGNHQQINAALALASLPVLVDEGVELNRDDVLTGLRNVHWPGRFEIVNKEPTVIVDGAHNLDSLSRLHHTVAQLFHRHRMVLVLGISRDKDLDGMIGEVAEWSESILDIQVERVIVTRSHHPRSADPQELALKAAEKGLLVEIEPTVEQALARAEAVALSVMERNLPVLVLVTGSLFTVAEAREYYGLMPNLSEERETGIAAASSKRTLPLDV
jgi:dihydrofolate synthase/folylpolyglutamate synthase